MDEIATCDWVPELARGKTGRVVGHLMGLITLMKGQPLAYNKDNQEDKEPLFDAADTLRDSLRAFADMVPAIKPKREIMREAALRGFSTATDLADYLVRKGLPFRDCHEIVGHAVMLADPDFAELYRRFGRAASATRSDQLRTALARLFWFTMEVGAVMEEGRLRVCGAALLSSASAMAAGAGSSARSVAW